MLVRTNVVPFNRTTLLSFEWEHTIQRALFGESFRLQVHADRRSVAEILSLAMAFFFT
jgi:hypothetical protein